MTPEKFVSIIKTIESVDKEKFYDITIEDFSDQDGKFKWFWVCANFDNDENGDVLCLSVDFCAREQAQEFFDKVNALLNMEKNS